MGSVIAPASTVMQNALPLARAGAGSAVQNTVRQVFGALGVAIVGTILATQYHDKLAPTLTKLPPTFPAQARAAVESSVAAVPAVIQRAQTAGAPADLLSTLKDGAFDSYLGASHITTWLSGSLTLVAAIVVLTFLPRHVSLRRGAPAPEPTVLAERAPATD
jgi:hypothetical protein